jgi:hypothetical protein
MTTWSEFESAAPELAREGRRLLERRSDGHGMLATVTGERPPRINPVNVHVLDGGLYLFVIDGSAKHRDLKADGRYSLHAQLDADAPSEFSVRGRVRRVDDEALRASIGGAWSFTVDDSYVLYELLVESALLGVRPTPDDWPPRYERWPGSLPGQG